MLQGERVTLRAIRRDDLPYLVAYNNDLAVELAGGGDPPWPQSLERLTADFERDVAKGGRDGGQDGVNFVIEIDGRCRGGCVLFNVDQTARVAEVGIAIGDPAYWSQGYGRESIRLLVDYAFRNLNFRRVWLRVHAANERARRAYLACGFVEEGRLRRHVWSDGRYDDLLLMGRLRDEDVIDAPA